MTVHAENPTSGRRPLGRVGFRDPVGRTVATAPVRIVHLGLGSFHRAHQAWYTSAVDENAEWGIAAFTGRMPDVATALSAQDGLFTLIERSGTEDRASVVTSIVRAHPGDDITSFLDVMTPDSTALVTITVTESGYRAGADGRLDMADQHVAADIELVRLSERDESARSPETMPGRLVLGLAARRRAGGGPIAVVPCDNLPFNGTVTRSVVLDFAEAVGIDLAEWIRENVSFVSTSVDRITPRTTPEDIDTAAALTGWSDTSPVVAEPFRDWVLSGAFPAGRPPWERAGARFVDDLEPFERRKLWMLNGAHSLLAYAGSLRGHHTVSDAIADVDCRRWVAEFWDEASPHLAQEGLDLTGYREALMDRFANARIRHELAQIRSDGLTKVRVRIAPVALAERRASRSGVASARAIGAWVATVLSDQDRTSGILGADALGRPVEDRVHGLVSALLPELGADADFVSTVHAEAESFRARSQNWTGERA